MVLLETALAIPLLISVALSALAVGRVALDELAVAAAAREGALMASRGASDHLVRRRVGEMTSSAKTEIDRRGGDVVVRVRKDSSLVPGLGVVAVPHDVSAVASREPGVP